MGPLPSLPVATIIEVYCADGVDGADGTIDTDHHGSSLFKLLAKIGKFLP